VQIGDAVIENGAWTYVSALPESREIQGFVGFMPSAATRVDLGDNQLETGRDGNITGPLVDWLMREAGLIPNPEDFTRAVARKMNENGVAVSRMAVLIWSLHPMIAGKNYIWRAGNDEVQVNTPSYDIHQFPGFLNSPLQHVSQGRGGVRQRLADTDAASRFPIMDELRAEGATDYVAMPMPFSDGRTNVLTLTTDHPDGFTTENLGLVYECATVISRYYEVFMQRENAQALLETYVGKRSGARVLGGEIRRGDGEEIDAAVMFCDLRGSTRLEQDLPRAAYMELLNAFLDITSTVVDAHGGEVLKFIGDAVLAVFPAGADGAAANACALAAARAVVEAMAADEITAQTSCAIGIASGRVTYGNIGSSTRLDFTVIGLAANVAARLCDACKSQGQAIMVTDAVAEAQTGLTDLGLVALRNVSAPVHSFGVSA
jgi:adenylate cyclase